jgi:hypothetical protein
VSDTVRAAAAGGLIVALVACSPRVADDADDSGVSFPASCSADASPFLQPECLGALREACLGIASESACAGAPQFQFDGYAIECRWVGVTSFVDVATCTVESESFRCEAGLPPGDGPQILCHAIQSELEIVEMLDGPIGPWSAVGSDDDDVRSCGEGLVPPEPPLCACAPAECDPP